MPTFNVKTAVTSALSYLQFLQDKISNDIQDIRLEEVELSEDKKQWLITLGYDIPVKHRNALEFMTPQGSIYKREYRLFKVNSETGEVEAMKIREV